MPEQSRRTRKNEVSSKAKQSFTQVRIDDDTFAKGKILAAIYGESFNHLMVRAVRNEIQNYESKNGALPKPTDPDEN